VGRRHTRTDHDHQVPRPLRFALVALTLMVLVLACCVWGLGVAVLRADEYVKGRGEYRDAETARMQQELNDLACGMLDTLPADEPLLHPMRDKYHCGPGVPFDELPPEIRRDIGDRLSLLKPPVIPDDRLPGSTATPRTRPAQPGVD